MLELIALITIVIIILIILKYKDNYVNETFINDENANLDSCPSGYKSIYGNDGDILCCNGQIIGNKCISGEQCILNTDKHDKDIPTCVSIINNIYKEKSKNVCPTTIGNYFEGSLKGCTDGPLNKNLNAPKETKQNTCYFYNDNIENENNINSCSNQKALDDAECFGNNCSKYLIKTNKNTPVLVAISFTDNSGMHRVAYTRESFIRHLDKVNPNWKSKGIDINRNIMIADVAKAYFIDRTKQKSDIDI
jgi:hypothetical protein